MGEEANRQLSEWVEGRPFHNTVDDECCPDFSCCRPELLAPRYAREAFEKADDSTRGGFLMGFLGGAFLTKDPTIKIHIAGDHGEEQ